MYPYLIKFLDFLDNSQEKMKHLGKDETSNEGCNFGPTWHDFIDNSITPQKKGILRNIWILVLR
jgi:hypothetical protein